MQFFRILQILIISALFLAPAKTHATVIEFHRDGTTTVYKAVDYISQKHRENKFSIPTLPKSKSEYDAIIEKISQKYAVDKNLISAIIFVESAGLHDAVSPKGAQGLMQLMPATAQKFGVSNVFDPEDNIEGGTKYLKTLLKMYEGNVELTLAAYNAGEGAVNKYNGVPPYPETEEYIRKIRLSLGSGFNEVSSYP